MYPFRMLGRVVQIYRYSVEADEEHGGEILHYPTKEEAEKEAERVGGAVFKADNSAAEWMDGLEVADVPDTYAEAVRIFEMGREAYEAELAADPEADRDELLLDLAVRLTLLEMGVNG